jgi:hypothetical protein
MNIVAESGDFKQAYVRLCSLPTGRWFAHPELRPRLVADAAAQETSMTEVAIKILCKHLGLQHVPNSRRTKAKEDETLLNLLLPGYVYRALLERYPMKQYCDAIREILCAYYGLEAGGPARGRVRTAA